MRWKNVTDSYAEYVMEQYEEAKKSCKDPIILIEQKLDFSCYVPDGFGTGDCIIISDDTLHIIDFKYGLGILVESEENPQMMLYALGALEIYDALYDIKTVSMTIFQPRKGKHQHLDDSNRTAEVLGRGRTKTKGTDGPQRRR